MIILPQCVARLGDLAGDGARYAMSGVLIEPPREAGESWRLVATDGRMLGIVQGPPEEDDPEKQSSQWHSRQALLSAVDVSKVEEAAAVMPINEWEVMARLRPSKDNKGQKHLALLVSEKQVVYALGQQVGQALTVQGRYPDYRAVLPRKLPLLQVRLGARLLAELCEVAAHVVGDRDAPLIINIYGVNEPIGVMARNEDTGLTFDGLLMPLTPPSS